jgi:hypothetical protein
MIRPRYVSATEFDLASTLPELECLRTATLERQQGQAVV